MLARSLVLGSLLFGLGGCDMLFGLKAKVVAVSSQPPSNVALFLELKDGDAPVKDLRPESFRILENGEEVPRDVAQATLLDPDVAAEQRTLLLVDGSTGGSEELAKGVAAFVAKLRRSQSVSVYVFDGGAVPTLIGEWPKSATAAPEPVPALVSYKARDASRDLYGSLSAGLELLAGKLKASARPIRVGTLVTFARGGDLAGRVTEKEFTDALTKSRFSAYAIGLPDKDDKAKLGHVGPAGVTRAESETSLAIAFENAADKAFGDAQRFYLLAYCSPARAGVRTLRVEIQKEEAEGKSRKGVVEVKFVASNFGPGCDPKAVPHFAGAEELEVEKLRREEAEKAAAAKSAEPAPKAPPAKPATAPKTPPKTGGQPEERPKDGVVPPPDNPRYTE